MPYSNVKNRSSRVTSKKAGETMNTHGEETIRNVVLNMTMTFDGFFAGPHGELDWMVQTPDQELNDDIVAFFRGIDRGFIGYPTARGMIPYWLNVANNPSASSAERAIAQAVNTLHPLILSRKPEPLAWEHPKLLSFKSDQDP